MESTGSINVKIRSQDGREKNFLIKQSTLMNKLLVRYCEAIHVEFETIEFLIGGKRFPKDKTPAELKLKDGVVIDAMMHQNGGGWRAI